MKTTLAILALAAMSTSALAADWNEVADAGALPPGQHTIGSGSLDRILGNLGGGVLDLEDMYCIRIVNPQAFSATTIGGATFDTQLFLFNANGLGVTFNDDATGVQSRITGQFVPAPGVYFLAISGYDHDAADAGGAQIWNDTPFGSERAPDGPGAANPIAGWIGSGATGAYTITLTGAEFCQVPAPGAMALLGLGGLAVARRRRA